MKEIKEYSHITFEEFHSLYHFMPSTTFAYLFKGNKQ